MKTGCSLSEASRPLALISVLATMASFPALASAVPNETSLVSRSSGPAGAKADGYSSQEAISADGRFVAFASSAKNLTDDGPARFDFINDVYLRDTQTQSTKLISRSSGANGLRGSGSSNYPAISADGRYVAFVSDSELLTPDDPDFEQDVFLRDTLTNTTTLVSRASGPAGVKGDDDSTRAAISSNGRFIAFTSSAENLTRHIEDPAENNGFPTDDVYLRDTLTDTTTLVSRSGGVAGAKGDDSSFASSITPDGRYVGFSSSAGNLSPGDGDTYSDVFVRDTQTNTTSLVSRADGSEGSKGNYTSFGPRLSDDGRFAAFYSEASNLSPDDWGYEGDVFVRDLQLQTTTFVSDPRRFDDDKGDSGRFGFSFSQDGRFVLFSSESFGLVPDDDDSESDLLVRDVQTGGLELVSRASGPGGSKANRGAYGGSISADGTRVAFHSGSTNLTPDDADDKTDVFLRERVPAGPDLTAPETKIDLGPGSPNDDRARSDTTPTFHFHASEPGSRLECRVGSAQFTPCTSPHTTAPLADGSYTFDARATDRAGNADPSPARREFTIDTVPPDTTITSGPEGTTADNTPRFWFSSSEGGSGYFSECRVDEGQWQICGGPFDIRESLPDGPHSVEIRAKDEAENVDPTPARREFTVRAAPLETTIESGPSGPTNSSEGSFSFSTPHPDQLFQCRYDGGSFRWCESPYMSGFSEGPHVFEVRAIDSASNVDPTPARREFTVDTRAPDTFIEEGPSGQTTDETPTFRFGSSEPGSSFECSLNDGAFASCGSPHTTPTLAQGSHVFEVRAVDSAANADPIPARQAFTVVAASPPPGPSDPESGGDSDGAAPDGGNPNAEGVGAALRNHVRRSMRVIRRLGLAGLRRRGAFVVRRLTVPRPGRYVASLAAPKRSGGRLQVARVSLRVSSSRRFALRVRLTPSGRRLLRRAQRVRLTLRVELRRGPGRVVTRSGRISLKR